MTAPVPASDVKDLNGRTSEDGLGALSIPYRTSTKLLSWLRKLTGWCIRATLQRDRSQFYDDRYSIANPIVLFVKNVLKPGRILKKMAYGQYLIPPALSKATRVESGLDDPDREQIELLRRDGLALWPGYFREEALRIAERFQVGEAFAPTSEYDRAWLDPNDPDVFSIITDTRLLSYIAAYYGCQPFHRYFPGRNATYPRTGTPLDLRANVDWHSDTPNQVVVHVLLNDVAPQGTRMLLARGSHRAHHIQLGERDSRYSEEYLRDHYHFADCCGPAGTVVIFDSNAVHRLERVEGAFRGLLAMAFTPGNDIQQTREDQVREYGALGEIPRLDAGAADNLSPLQSGALRYLVDASTDRVVR